MTKYRATATVTGSKYLGEFEADDGPAGAERLAWMSEAAQITVCHQCTVEAIEDPEVTEITVEEVGDD